MGSNYKPEENREYQEYLKKLEAVRQDKPQYTSGYAAERQELYDQLKNRPDFSYDINSDALYRQLSGQYLRQGRLAMADTMAQAQAMTGGYGNSYAQGAGQQAYQGYLRELHSLAPEYYDRALERYQAQGQSLEDRYARATEQEQAEYAKYKEALDAHRRDLEFLQSRADQAYDRGYRQYLEGYTRQDQEYDRLVSLIEKHGYQPTDQELQAAGMTRAQAEAMLR